ncbi:MAG: NADH-quinone oxidoreductase subunit F [Gammaproteobacteria bacterium]|nr:NADH-quinone oxidoreductase subunit F [Gammaproteobacteria bacterium]|tara:strand:+ start:1607 stop:3601 length:1995 start_codon:yes stop_codon:yes gene_type:complete
MPKLTNEIIDNTVIKPSDYRLTDGSGLTIIIRKNGNKHWQFRYHVYESGKRKERIYSLGEYPSVSIEQARSEHKQLKDKLSNGIDIQTLKNKQKLTSNDKVPSFLELAREKKFKKNKKLRNRGRKVNFNIRDDLIKLLQTENYRRDHLIEYLHKIQDSKGHINEEYMSALANLMGISQTEVYEVATFYHHFDIIKTGDTIPPSLTIRVCDSVSCEINGANELAQNLDDYYKGTIRVQKVPCIGRCQHAPVAVVKFNPVDNANLKNVKQAVDAGDYLATVPNYINMDEYIKNGGYQSYEKLTGNEAEQERVLKELENSNLRGLGGAGFPAGRKWRILKEQSSPRLLAVNIDEGEPGTFKDRFYLESDPHRFFEGMLMASEVVGIDKIYIYLRDEYAAVRTIMIDEIEKIRNKFQNTIPEIELRRGAGAYICGEESAMIESIEGKKGMPRLRPPFVAQVGLFGRPTLEHNMETLYWVRDIAEKGAKWFTSYGRNGRNGLRSFSVSGRVKKPGVHLAPAGITVKELIEEYAGGMLDNHKFYAYFPGGASGGILPASMSDIPLDFDTLNEYDCFIGSAAIIILSDHDKVVKAASTTMSFFEHESCGKCTPCRVGTSKATKLMKQEKWNIKLLNDLANVMSDSSICGLGQAASNPLKSVLKHFPKEIKE